MPGFKSRLAHQYTAMRANAVDDPMIKDIIFDVGGVLLKYREAEYYRYISRKYGLSETKVSRTLNPMIEKLEIGQMTLKHMRARASKEFGIPNADLEWVRFFKAAAKPDSYVIGLAKHLERRYRVSVLSNISRSRYSVARELFLHDLGAYRIFTSCYMGMRKPSKKIYLSVLRDLGAKPEETVFIDNLKANVDGAKKVGIRAVQFKNHEQIHRALRRLGVETA